MHRQIESDQSLNKSYASDGLKPLEFLRSNQTKNIKRPEMHETMEEQQLKLADKIGIVLSGLCVVHCLLTPFVILLIPSLELASYHDLFHDVLLGVLPLVALSAFIPGYRRHRNFEVFLWSLPGLAMVAIGALVFHEQVVGQVLFSIAGSLLLIKAHLVNRALCTCCSIR